mmetsp:Transcript_36545/g.70127  ORF Transcript_36545/g.70127 Transcript_36545/m.70127 type:complete len:246 (-) Transcript_36545:2769-3506(-)
MFTGVSRHISSRSHFLCSVNAFTVAQVCAHYSLISEPVVAHIACGRSCADLPCFSIPHQSTHADALVFPSHVAQTTCPNLEPHHPYPLFPYQTFHIVACAEGECFHQVRAAVDDCLRWWLPLDRPDAPGGAGLLAPAFGEPLLLLWLEFGATTPTGSGRSLHCSGSYTRGRYSSSSHGNRELRKCSSSACWPCTRAYVISHTFLLLNSSQCLSCHCLYSSAAAWGEVRFTKAYPRLQRFLKSIGR